MLLDLFLCFVQVGLFSIGGGYAAMPMIQAKAVEYYHWLTMSEFTDLMTIAEMTPGPITVNSATFVGIRMAGIPGALVATMGCILPQNGQNLSIDIIHVLRPLYSVQIIKRISRSALFRKGFYQRNERFRMYRQILRFLRDHGGNRVRSAA